MKLLRVGGAHETVSIGRVISLAFRNSMSFCNPSSNPARVSCVAALGCNEGREIVLCSGKLLAEGSAASANATPPKTISPTMEKPSRCMIVLVEGLICFFTVVALGTLGGGETDLDRRSWLSRIHNHGVVRLHIARAF